jgi:hypothetical protein
MSPENKTTRTQKNNKFSNIAAAIFILIAFPILCYIFFTQAQNETKKAQSVQTLVDTFITMEELDQPVAKTIPILEAQQWSDQYLDKAVLLTNENQNPLTPYILMCGVTTGGSLEKYILSTPESPNPDVTFTYHVNRFNRHGVEGKTLDNICFKYLRTL